MSAVHGSGLLCSGNRGGLFAKDFPRDVGPKHLTPDLLALLPSRPLDDRAVLSRDAVLQPGLNRLVPLVRDVEEAGGLHRAAKDGNRAFCSGLSGCLVFHSCKCTQENLVMLELLAFADRAAHEKLAQMSIHEEIKTRRLALDWSHQRLAEEVSKLEGRAKPLSWQTVQQWENSTSAPKRSRLAYVAKALGTTVDVLMSGAPTQESESRHAVPYGSTSSTNEPAKDAANIARHPTQTTYPEDFLQYEGWMPVVAVAKVQDAGFYEEQLAKVEGAEGWVPRMSTGPAYALRVKGDGLAPTFRNGSFILVSPTARLDSNEEVVVGFKDGRRAVRLFLKQGKDTLSVSALGGGAEQTLDTDDVEFVHPIVAICKPNQWVAERPTGATSDRTSVADEAGSYGALINKRDAARSEKESTK